MLEGEAGADRVWDAEAAGDLEKTGGNVSIAGYLSAGRRELRMPKKKSGDKLNIRFEGAVLTGEKTVDEKLREDAVGRIVVGDEYYETAEDYDPVLRGHRRLIED